jgi:hypothetical protein
MPWPLGGSGTGPYLALYVLTLAVHAALIGYVLAGAGYAAIAAAARDWLPFYLGAAITAGVAPLLFVQVLYQDRVYTAQLLMGPRWFAIIPALVIGFYALYLHKATTSGGRRLASIAMAAACFGFVAWSWTEHHGLMTADTARWHAMYAAGERMNLTAPLVPRFFLWVTAALPMFAVIAAWQVGDDPPARRRLGVIALVGLVASTVLAVVVRGQLAPAARAGADAATPWLVVLVAGRVAEAVGWILVVARKAPRLALPVVTAGAAASVVAGAILREAARVHLATGARSSPGGAVVFAVALVGVTAAIVWIARMVRRAPPAPAPDASSTDSSD